MVKNGDQPTRLALLAILTGAVAGIGAQATRPASDQAAPGDRIVAVFDEQPIEFDKALADDTIAATGDGQVRLFRNGQQIERTPREIGSSVSTIRGEDLTQAREPNFISALAGRAPGVEVLSSSGAT